MIQFQNILIGTLEAMRACIVMLPFMLPAGALADSLQADITGPPLLYTTTDRQAQRLTSPTGSHYIGSGTRRASPRLDPGTRHSISDPDIRQPGMHAMHSVIPYVIDDAIVKGPTGRKALALWEKYELQTPGGGRGLLHGRRKPRRYAKCNSCTIVRCAGGNACTGHCRKNRKVFHCSEKHRTGGKTGCSSRGDPTVSPLEPPDSLVVTATAPFIGCVHIADRPAEAACPAPWTRGVMQAVGSSISTAYAVEFSSCTRTEYTPECISRPYYPLGVCLCSKVSLSGASLGLDACDARELDLPSTDSRSDPEEVRVVIEERGATVQTGIFDYTEPEDVPADEAEVRIQGIETDPNADVTVSLRIYQGRVTSDRNTEVGDVDGVVSDDYYDSTEVSTAGSVPAEAGGVLPGETSRRLEPPRNTNDSKHLQPTQTAVSRPSSPSRPRARPKALLPQAP